MRIKSSAAAGDCGAAGAGYFMSGFPQSSTEYSIACEITNEPNLERGDGNYHLYRCKSSAPEHGACDSRFLFLKATTRSAVRKALIE